MGFLIMGVIGYVVKLGQFMRRSTMGRQLTGFTVHIPVNNILVGGA